MKTKKQTPIILLIGFLLILVFTLPLSAKSNAYLGVYLSDISESKYEKYAIKGHYGVLIQTVVKDGPAKEAGLKSKDVILEINGEKVYTNGQVKKMLSNYEPKQVVKIKILRDGKEKTFKVTLRKRKEFFGDETKAYLGVYLEDLSDEDYEEIGLDDNYGVLIIEVVDDGPAEKAGIKNDDVIMEIEKDKVYTSDQLSKMLYSFEPEQEVEVLVFRSGDKKTCNVKLGEKEIGFHDFDFDRFFDKPKSVFVYKYKDNDTLNTEKIEISFDGFNIYIGDEKENVYFNLKEFLQGVKKLEKLEDLKELEKLKSLKDLEKLEKIKIKIESEEDNLKEPI